MANVKISELPALGATPATDDRIVIYDTSTSTDKTMTVANMLAAGGSGTVTVVGAGSLTSTALMTGGGTTTAQTPSATSTMDASGNISTPGSLSTGVGGSVAGNIALTQGTAPSAGTTNVTIFAPASVTSYLWKLPAAAATGFVLGTNSSGTVTLSHVGSTGSGNVVLDTSPTFTTPAAFTTGGTITLAENTSIALDPAGSADGKWTGISVTATAGYTQSFGDLVYLDPTDSRWEAVDANSAAGADGDARGMLGMVVSAGTDGNACTILLHGIIRADAKFPTFTVNNPIYASETAAAVTQTQPTTTDVVIRVIGSALTADELYFSPSPDYITHT